MANCIAAIFFIIYIKADRLELKNTLISNALDFHIYIVSTFRPDKKHYH